MSKNIKEEIISAFLKTEKENFQTFKTAQDKIGELKRKMSNYSARNDDLKSELELVFKDAKDVEEALGKRESIDAEINKNKEIITGIDQHFLPQAEKELQEATDCVVGVFFAIVKSLNEKEQEKINDLFNQINSKIKQFEDGLTIAINELFGSGYISPNQKRILQQFDLSHSPYDPSQNILAGTIARTLMNKS